MVVWAGCGAWTTGLLVVVFVVALAVERLGVRVAEWVAFDVEVRERVLDEPECDGTFVAVDVAEPARSSPPFWAL